MSPPHANPPPGALTVTPTSLSFTLPSGTTPPRYFGQQLSVSPFDSAVSVSVQTQSGGNWLIWTVRAAGFRQCGRGRRGRGGIPRTESSTATGRRRVVVHLFACGVFDSPCLPVIFVGVPGTFICCGLTTCTPENATPSMETAVPESNPLPLICKTVPAGSKPPSGVTLSSDKLPPAVNCPGLTVTQ